MAVRKAADPGVVAWITGLRDGYEKAWRDGATAAIRPIDRALANDEDRLGGVSMGTAAGYRAMAERYGPEGDMRDFEGSAYSVFGDGLNRIDPSGALFNAYNKELRASTEDDQYPPRGYALAYAKAQAAAEKSGDSLEKGLAASVFQSAKKYGYDAESVKRFSQQGGVPEGYLLTRAGQFARDFIGNPYAAYGLPAAGVGLAAWGIHDVMAAQQQSVKDSQLPLQGGLQ